MSGPAAALSLVTLGVSDLARSIAFYEALGFPRKARSADGVGFFQAGGCVLAVFPRASLADEAAIRDHESAGGFRGVALAWNCRTDSEVNAAVECARGAGAVIIKQPQKTFWGGYVGYFTDPDGHLWEVAHNPHWPLTDDGRLILPN